MPRRRPQTEAERTLAAALAADPDNATIRGAYYDAMIEAGRSDRVARRVLDAADSKADVDAIFAAADDGMEFDTDELLEESERTGETCRAILRRRGWVPKPFDPGEPAL